MSDLWIWQCVNCGLKTFSTFVLYECSHCGDKMVKVGVLIQRNPMQKDIDEFFKGLEGFLEREE